MYKEDIYVSCINCDVDKSGLRCMLCYPEPHKDWKNNTCDSYERYIIVDTDEK